jgi:ubiquinone/menaquinone biosynthesis C-methylase UbiE
MGIKRSDTRIQVLKYIMETYDKQASYYDDLHEHEQKTKYSIVLGKIVQHLTKAKLCFDCGCGTGFLIKELQSQPFTIVGLDISKEMLRKTSHKIKEDRLNINLIRGDSSSIPLKDSIFDVIFAFTILDGEVNWIKTLRELHRVSVSNGILVTSMLRACPSISEYTNIIVSLGQEILDVIDVHRINEIILISKKVE